MCLKARHAKFQRFSAREIFAKFGANKERVKNVRLSTEK